MPEPLLIRPVRNPDQAQWLALWEGYNIFYDRVGAAALPDSVTQLTWARLLDPAAPMHGLVAEQDGVLLGLTHYLYHPSTSAAGPVCYLQDLFTLATARGKGVGRALIAAVHARAGEAGAARVYWQTQAGNAVARRLYDQVAENSGFIVYRMPM